MFAVAAVREFAWMTCCSLLASPVTLPLLKVFYRAHIVRLQRGELGVQGGGNGGMRTYIRGVVLNIFLGRVSAMFCLERFLPCLDAGLDMCNVHVWSGVRGV